MRTRARFWIVAFSAFIAFGWVNRLAVAASSEIDPIKQHDQLVGELTSGDDARANKVFTLLQSYMKKYKTRFKRETAALLVLLDAKRFADVDEMAKTMIVRDPSVSEAVAAYEKKRAEAFLAAGDTASALAASKSYYNVAQLPDTADAIKLVAQCLAAANPNDSTIGQRFADQQIALSGEPTPSTAMAPSAQPETAADNTPAPSMLLSIAADAKPFESTIPQINLKRYKDFVSKGNLLLLADHCAEARQSFEQALSIAPAEDAADAQANVARAIRAQSGCIAPANAYIASIPTNK